MKKSIFVIGLILGFSLQAWSQTDMIPKVAVVDINALYQEANKNSPEVKKVEALREKHNAELKKQQDAIAEMEERLAEAEAKNDKSKIRDLARRIEIKKNDVISYRQRATDELKKANDAIKTDPTTLNLIKRAIEIVANKRGYSLVLSSSSSGIVYWSNKIDITREVIETIISLQK